MEEGGGQNGNVHMLPLEGEHQGCDALCHRHQPLVVCCHERKKVSVKDMCQQCIQCILGFISWLDYYIQVLVIVMNLSDDIWFS